MESFKDKFNLILDTIGATGADIAKLAKVDRTNISRFKSGAREPKPESNMSIKIIDGIYLYVDRYSLFPALCDLTGLSSELSADDFKKSLQAWLYDGIGQDNIRSPQNRHMAAKSFGDRLTLAMSLAGVSNRRLSNILYIDESLISRYRTGERFPRSNSDIIISLAYTLYELILENGEKSRLAEIMKMKEADMDENYFMDWLYAFADSSENYTPAAEDLLAIFDSFSTMPGTDIDLAEPALDEKWLCDSKDLYVGIDGLRESVIKFLSIVACKHLPEIWLYSDQNMEWMVGNEEYFRKWAYLMGVCLKNGTRMRIIHNIDRNLSEMNSAIESWLPLYMSGLIEPYYCKKSLDQRFSHTMFCCPQNFCIEACHITGMEDEGIYHFYTDMLHLDMQEKAYKKLLDFSAPLISFREPFDFDLSECIKPDIPFDNVELAMNKDTIKITNIRIPALSFYFSHPLMIRAFKEYVKNIDPQIKAMDT